MRSNVVAFVVCSFVFLIGMGQVTTVPETFLGKFVMFVVAGAGYYMIISGLNPFEEKK